MSSRPSGAATAERCPTPGFSEEEEQPRNSCNVCQARLAAASVSCALADRFLIHLFLSLSPSAACNTAFTDFPSLVGGNRDGCAVDDAAAGDPAPDVHQQHVCFLF